MNKKSTLKLNLCTFLRINSGFNEFPMQFLSNVVTKLWKLVRLPVVAAILNILSQIAQGWQLHTHLDIIIDILKINNQQSKKLYQRILGYMVVYIDVYTVWTAVCLRLRMMLGHGSTHLDCCLPETEGDARPWQYTVWTAVCLRLRVMLGHGSTQSGLLSA